MTYCKWQKAFKQNEQASLTSDSSVCFTLWTLNIDRFDLHFTILFLAKMSLRSLTRAPPKRMLVYFEADESHLILPTNKVRKICSKNQKLEEGANVIVDYENMEYEALVLKLHGKYDAI